MKKHFSLKGWIDNKLLFWLSLFLLVFIPLYPKLPLFDVLPGYIVRVRLEDFFVGFVFLFWFVQAARKKVTFKNPLFWPIVIYLIIGFISSLSAIFITKTVPLQNIHIVKLFLHFFRRIEYFSLFFILYSSIKEKRQIKIAIFTLAVIALALFFYGMGQKYLGWPVYSTMNREFAKGWRLVLTEHARVPSTFAGHYDLAAFLVMILAVFGSLALFVKKGKEKFFFSAVFISSFILLMYTASRTSFIAYLVAICVVAFVLSFQKGFLWAVSRGLMIVVFSFLIMTNFRDISERFAHFFKFEKIGEFLKDKVGLKGDFRYIPISGDLSLVYTPSDQPPVPFPSAGFGGEGKAGPEFSPSPSPSGFPALPPDVYKEIPNLYTATEAGGATLPGEQREKIAEIPRVYSPTAFTFGLSSAIRFDVLWPRAIERFLKNPLLGTGYSTLTKVEWSDFTEAESTDNDYLRALGETGILGFLSFMTIFFVIFRWTWRRLPHVKEPFAYAFFAGVVSGIVGLLVNAFYIDVFEASKVAFIFWALIGILLSSIKLYSKKEIKY